MFKSIFSVGVAASMLAATPALAATTFNLGGSSDDSVVKVFTSGDLSLVAAGFTYSGPPSGFPNGTGDVIDAALHQSAAGIGVCPGETGAFCNQVDSNSGDNEGVLFFLADGSDFALSSITFSIVDDNDTLQLVGLTDTGTVPIGFSGTIAGGLPGTTTTRLSNGTYRVDLATGAFQGFAFGQQRSGADGFRINSITVAAVPEPASWAMMIAGVALVGSTARRRRRMVHA
ncbi:hypothetical protein GGR88_001294 [Sphingomonas jejuensis]|uniref:Ice-binding protein C-terminal domain-containing protein n=1 Tax=Sphingomonas jejuensis TaxID=904715 RepID=A0ABX0XKR2_9SPHN|nr:PEPxxWA-CTERM sorting domain-containing protein [Sphingomonas jejuensis]NJC33820.1 hypothetical protein [Sphingomonas jejuensis]